MSKCSGVMMFLTSLSLSVWVLIDERAREKETKRRQEAVNETVCVYAVLSRPSDSSHYLIPVLPLRVSEKNSFVPRARLYLRGYLPRDE